MLVAMSKKAQPTGWRKACRLFGCVGAIFVASLHAAEEKTGKIPQHRLSAAAFWQPYEFDEATLCLYHLDEAHGKAKKPATGDETSSAESLLDDLDAHEEAGVDQAQIAANASKFGKDALLKGECRFEKEGRFSGSAYFAGKDGSLVIRHSAPLANRTLEFWLKPQALPADSTTLVFFFCENPKAAPSALKPVSLLLKSNGSMALAWQGREIAAKANLKAGEWAHIALAWCDQWAYPYANTAVVLLNGNIALKARFEAQETAAAAHLSSVLIGNGPDSKTGFQGWVDEIRFSKYLRAFYAYDLAWPQPAARRAANPGQPFFRDAADLIFRLSFDKTLKSDLCAPNTKLFQRDMTKADEELDADRINRLFPPAVDGAGLLLGEGSLAPCYEGEGNIDPREGTIAFWMLPLDWDNRSRSSRFGRPPLWWGLFQIHGEYPEGSWERKFKKERPLFEFNLNAYPDEEANDPPDFNPGQWSHVAVAWEGANLTYFINGAPRQPDNAFHTQMFLWEGNDPRNPGHPEWWTESRPRLIRFGERLYWDGKIAAPRTIIDDFRIYRRRLSLLEIGNLVKLHDPRTKLEPLPAADMDMHWNGVSGRIKLSVTPLIAEYQRAAKCAARLEKEGGEKPLAAAVCVFDDRKQAIFEIKTQPLEFAAYKVVAEIQDAAGKTLGTVEKRFVREKPPWWQCQAGISDKVLPGWTPMEAHGNTIRLWGREIHIGQAGLPAKVISQGQDILAAPIKFELSVDGKAAALADAGKGLEIVSAKEARVDFCASAAAGDCAVTTRAYAEFDGMIWFEVSLAPLADKPVTIDRLAVRVPYAAGNAEYIHWWSGSRNFRNPKVVWIGSLPKGEGTVFRSNDRQNVELLKEQAGTFIPYVMLTGMKRGMAWFAENDRGWTQSQDTPAVAVERQGEAVILTLNIISEPVSVTGPRTFAFGLHPIPVKPLDQNWRLSPAYSNVFPDTFCGNSLKGRQGPTAFYLYPEDDWDAVMRRIEGEGLSKGAAGLKGLYENQLKLLAAQGIDKPLPVQIAVPGLYWDMQWNGIPRNLSHTREWAETWAPNYQSYTPEFIDFVSWCWNEWIVKTDKFVRGAYIDDCWGAPQTVAEGLNCHQLPEGRVQPGYQFRAWRERFKRMRHIMVEHGLGPHLTSHTTHTFFIPYHSFFDLILDGEDFYSEPPRQDDFIDHWRPDRLRFMHNAKWGLITTWLGWCSGGLKTNKWPAWTFRQTRAYQAHLAQHDIRFELPEAAIKEFGLREADVEFLPYWENGKIAVRASPDLYVTIWKRQGKCLVMLVNMGKERMEGEVRFDCQALGLGDAAAVRAKDVDPDLLTYFAEDTTNMETPKDMVEAEKETGEDATAFDQAAKGETELDDIALEVKKEDLPLEERRRQDPDGKFSWEKSVLRCPVRKHDYRLFIFLEG